ncbi:MAG: hypothetical protein K0R34_170 [Herbinix sp.]|jgi:uncharacterized membrane protein|nr:hypothetical protein [Herbinix sp.]
MSKDGLDYNQNKEKVPRTVFHKGIELATIAVLIIMVTYPIAIWNTLPDKLPMHYNVAGEIDRWGSRAELFTLPVIGLFMYGLLSLVSSFPSTWNIPVTITRENRTRVYQCTKSMLLLMKLEVIILFAYLEYQVIGQRELTGSFLSIVLLVIFGTIVYFIRRMYKVAKRKVN